MGLEVSDDVFHLGKGWLHTIKVFQDSLGEHMTDIQTYTFNIAAQTITNAKAIGFEYINLRTTRIGFV
jgi:hypothetical protein